MRFNLMMIDLLVLRTVYSFNLTFNRPIKQRELYDSKSGKGIVNDTIDNEALPAIFNLRPLTGNWPLEESIQRLRDARLMNKRAPYLATTRAKSLFEIIGNEPRDWPIQLPVYDGEVLIGKARYVPEELR